jgi:hypothetical protein
MHGELGHRSLSSDRASAALGSLDAVLYGRGKEDAWWTVESEMGGPDSVRHERWG